MTFVEVNDVDKRCKIIINLDMVEFIAPVSAGGCHIFTRSDKPIKVSDSYDMFSQFALAPVTADDIASRIEKLTGKKKV